MTPVSVLLGARIRRIDAPHAELLSLVIAGPELRSVLLFCFSSRASGVGLVESRPQGNAANSFVQKLRKELEGSRISALEQPRPAALALLTQRGPTQRRLECDFETARITLQDEAGQPLASQTCERVGPASRMPINWPDSIEALLERGSTLRDDSAAFALAQRRAQLAKLLRNAAKRLERRMLAMQEDMARASQAEPLRAQGNLVLANLSQIKRGNSSVDLLDYTQDPPSYVAIALDPSRDTRDQVEGWFKLARRYERGAQLALQRTAATQEELARLAPLLEQLETADNDTLDQLAQTARGLGVRGISASNKAAAGKATRPARHKPYRELRGHGQRAIFVGKGAEDNDTLTRDHARPHDLWLHARDVTGAHVVVPLERNETCPQELLLDAAHLAAHFSDARNQSIVDVSYTPKRYVRKPRHAPKGQVQVEREKVITLHLDPNRLAKLLASEVQL